MSVVLNGKEMDFFAASGSLGFDGRGWLWNRWRLSKDVYPPPGVCAVLKTVGLDSCRGNRPFPWLKIRRIFEKGKLVGYVNCLGLPGPSFYEWRETYARKIDFENQNVVFSFISRRHGHEEIFHMAEIAMVASELNTLPFIAVELNSSCPNSRGGVTDTEITVRSCEFLREHVRHPIILKLSYAQNYVDIVKRVEADAFSFNTIPWSEVFPNKKSPFEKFGGGGVSGKIARPFYEKMARKIRDYSDVPIIMPVWDYKDIFENKKYRPNGNSFGSVTIHRPDFPTLARKMYRTSDQ